VNHHSIAASFPSYPPDNRHCSEDVYLREGGGSQKSEAQSSEKAGFLGRGCSLPHQLGDLGSAVHSPIVGFGGKLRRPGYLEPNGMGCPLVVHYLADLQSVHGFGFRCYDNTSENAKCQRVLVLALCLAIIIIIIITVIIRKASISVYLLQMQGNSLHITPKHDHTAIFSN